MALLNSGPDIAHSESIIDRTQIEIPDLSSLKPSAHLVAARFLIAALTTSFYKSCGTCLMGEFPSGGKGKIILTPLDDNQQLKQIKFERIIPGEPIQECKFDLQNGNVQDLVPPRRFFGFGPAIGSQVFEPSNEEIGGLMAASIQCNDFRLVLRRLFPYEQGPFQRCTVDLGFEVPAFPLLIHELPDLCGRLLFTVHCRQGGKHDFRNHQTGEVFIIDKYLGLEGRWLGTEKGIDLTPRAVASFKRGISQMCDLQVTYDEMRGREFHLANQAFIRKRWAAEAV